MATPPNQPRSSRPTRPGLMLKRGFLRRCPVCGQGHLFRHWTKMIARCPTCGYRFHRAPGQWLGSWFLAVCLAQMVGVLFLIIAVIVMWPEPVNGWVAAAAVAVTIGWVFLFFPFSRTIWCAIDLAMKPLEFDDDVPPGYELQDEIDAFLGEEARRPPN